MPPTIQDVLGLDPVRRGRPEVVAGAGLLDRPVRWAHVSQLTDLTGLLRGGELVLTTADPLRRAAPPPAAYLRHLADAGAAGVVVETPDPDPGGGFAAWVREAAAGLAFPVVLLGRPVRFVEVTEAVHARIVNESYAEVRFAQRAHEVFTALSLQAAPPGEIVARAAELAGTAVVYEDVAHRVVASAPGPYDDGGGGLLADWERRARLAAGEWPRTPVDVHGQRWGRLVMPDERTAAPPDSGSGDGDGDGAADGRLGMVLERAAQALTLRLMTEQSQADVALRAQSGLVAELAEGRAGGEAEALARARAVGLGPAAVYVPVAVRYDPGAAPGSAEELRRDREFVAAVARAVAAAGLSSLTSSVRIGEVALLLACPRPYDERRVLERFAELLARHLPGPAVPRHRIGVAPARPELTAAARRLAEAAHVAEVAAAVADGPVRPYYRAEDLRLRGLLSLLRDNRHLRAFAETELRRLLDHEARHDSGHLALLRRYLEVNGNKNELARRAGLSRPALYARLAAVERILSVRLDDPETRASLYVALLVRDLAADGSGDR
ncbi:PucR family transcriptional regulator [Streptomyces sp. MAR4 CNX-425]|uniref:PucR family transcriptional regulator n=1 Tax=Streptomyces sp. MAR4 CNX-425 TaxID=3406343 RepID=UPI003B50CBE5